MKSLLPKNVYAGENATENLIHILSENNVKQLLVFTDKGILNSGLLDYLLGFVSKDRKSVV